MHHIEFPVQRKSVSIFELKSHGIAISQHVHFFFIIHSMKIESLCHADDTSALHMGCLFELADINKIENILHVDGTRKAFSSAAFTTN